jgi:hypothetical protein
MDPKQNPPLDPEKAAEFWAKTHADVRQADLDEYTALLTAHFVRPLGPGLGYGEVEPDVFAAVRGVYPTMTKQEWEAMPYGERVAYLRRALPDAGNRPTRRRRGTSARKPRPLTPRQTEVVQTVGECKGNIAKAAQQLGLHRKTVEEAYKAGLAKLGKVAVKSRDKTRLHPRDKRGQAAIDADERLE